MQYNPNSTIVRFIVDMFLVGNSIRVVALPHLERFYQTLLSNAISVHITIIWMI